MRYRAKVKLIIGGWYKATDGQIVHIIKCRHVKNCVDAYKCKGQLFRVTATHGTKGELCGDGAFRAKIISYMTDEEIMLLNL
jgi:hypothetical protein